MKRKSLLIFFVGLMMSIGASAKHVSPQQARKVAEVFLQGVGCKQANHLIDRTAELPFRQFYLFSAEGGGFVLVAADDFVQPILGYSATGTFETAEMPRHVSDWFARYEKEIAICAQRSGGASASVALQWQRLLKGAMPTAVLDGGVGPLISTTWKQMPLYNLYCPADTGHYSGHALAGCAAISAAQVMKYWNFPTTGYGSHTYHHDTYGTLSARFDSAAYRWSDMPDQITSESTQEQIDAIATLVFHVGVAINMLYSPNGSGAEIESFGISDNPSDENALKNYFKYKGTLHIVYRSECSAAVYDSILRNELDNGRPVIYAGYNGATSGHAFNMDGYDSLGAYHVNWGWGGRCDGFFPLGALNPQEGRSYNDGDCAIVGIEPHYDFDTTANTSVTLSVHNGNYGAVTGEGTYSFGDTVTLHAIASHGCRFVRWSDDGLSNPRQFLAMGGDYSLTAFFEPLAGDTLGYAHTYPIATIVGTGDTVSECSWGIRLPASVLTPGRSLTAVQIGLAEGGRYRIEVCHAPDSAPVSVQEFAADNAEANRWKTIPLDTPVPIIPNEDIFIHCYNSNVENVVPLTYDCGNSDGLILSGVNELRSDRNYTAMIRGIFTADPVGIDPTNPSTLSLYPNPTTGLVIAEGGAVLMVRVYDLVGREVARFGSGNPIDLSSLAPGVYTLRLFLPQGCVVKKVVKE